MKKIILSIVVTAVVAVIIFYWQNSRDGEAVISNFNDCAEAGYPIAESYPRRCSVPGGESFTEFIGNELEKTDLIRIYSPRPNSVISNPLVFDGEARGYWFFEASFPVELLDANGKKIPLRPPYIMAGADQTAGAVNWMTTEFVPFHAIVEFDAPQTDKGTLILRKDNPSGLPEHDDELIIPVRFKR